MQLSEKPSPSSDAVGPGGPQNNNAAPVAESAIASGGAERRRHTRREILGQRLVSIELGANNGGLVLDLSTGGAAIVSVAPLERYSSSQFSFQIADSKLPIEGTGTFVWVDSTGLNAGLRFEHLSPTSKKLINQWLGDGPRNLPQESSAREASGEPSAQLDEAVAPPSLLPLEKGIDPELAAKLTRLAERARLVALANGACIALKGADGFRCEASVGTAPDIGLPLSQERTLAAECIAGRHLVVCNDAARDPRVNAATRERLNLGSAILLPLLHEGDLVGVLGAFAERRDAFGEQSIVRLQDAARLIESNLAGTARAPVKPASQPSDSNGAPASPPSNSRGARAKSDGIATSVARIFTFALIATLMLLGGVYLYQLREASSFSQPKAPPASFSVKKQRVETTVPAPAPEQSNLSADAKPPETTSLTAPARPLVKPDSSRALQTAAAVIHPAIEASHPVATRSSAPPPETPAVKPSAPSAQPVQQSSLPPTPVSPAASPHKQEAALTQLTPQLPAATNPAATPKTSPLIPHVQVLTDILRPRPGAGASPTVPELISKSSISYPQGAIASQRQGSVILKVTIAPNGAVQKIDLLDGDPVLSAEAVSTVRQWRYQPFKADARESGMELLLTVNFVLSR